MFNLFALLPDDPLKPATPMTNGAIGLASARIQCSNMIVEIVNVKTRQYYCIRSVLHLHIVRYVISHRPIYL